jgi:hypothetical protein
VDPSEITEIELPARGDYWQILIQRLSGKVFHITPHRNLKIILSDGFIRTNMDKKLKTGFGGGEGYFRKRNCVSFFDYRSIGTPEWERHYRDCMPINPLSETSPIAALFLTESYYNKLISWEEWKREQAYGTRVVPFIEAGHPGPVPIETISSILIVRRRDDHHLMERILLSL